MVSFENVIDTSDVDLYLSLLKEKNPNGCPARGSFYIEDAFSNYAVVYELFKDGHEIGINSLDGNPPSDWNNMYKSMCLKRLCELAKWAASWQNQQSECAPSQVSDQPGHPPSLIRVFADHMKKAWVLSYPLSAQRRLMSAWASNERTAKTLIRLVGCPGWSESSLGAHSLCWFCHVTAQMTL